MDVGILQEKIFCIVQVEFVNLKVNISPLDHYSTRYSLAILGWKAHHGLSLPEHL